MNRVIEEVEIEMGDINFRRRINGMNKYHHPFLMLELKDYMRVKKISFEPDIINSGKPKRFDTGKVIFNTEPIYTGLIYKLGKYHRYNYDKNNYQDGRNHMYFYQRVHYDEPIVSSNSILRIDYYELLYDTDDGSYQLKNERDRNREYKLPKNCYIEFDNFTKRLSIPNIKKMAIDNGFDKNKVIKKIVYKGKKNERIEYKDPNPYKKFDRWGNVKFEITLKDYIDFLMKL
jgi:hypothetical protein